MSTEFEKYAQELALAATTGNKEPLVSVAQPFTKAANTDLAALLKDPTVQRYLLGGLGGAGLGALVGAMQPQKKKRNALMYGLMGGAGGLGLAHLLSAMPRSTGGNPNKPVSEQSAADIQAAAQAAGMSPQEYLQKQKEQEANKAFLGSLFADGGAADRASGAAVGAGIGKGVQTTYGATRNRVLGTRDASGKLIPPKPELPPVQQAQAARRELKTNNAATAAARDNQLRLAQNTHDQARSVINPAEQTARGVFRAKLDRENANLKQQLSELARQNKAEPVDIVRDTIDPEYRQRQLQAQTQAAIDAARASKKTIAQNQPALLDLAAQRTAVINHRNVEEKAIAKDYNNRRTADYNAAKKQIEAARPMTYKPFSLLPRTIDAPKALQSFGFKRKRIPVRSPLGKAFQAATTVVPYMPAVIGGSAGLSGMSNAVGLGGETK